MSLLNSMHGERRGVKDPGKMFISQECRGSRSSTSKSTAAVTFFPEESITREIYYIPIPRVHIYN